MMIIYITILIVIVLIVTIKAQNMSPFEKATQSGWYPYFLQSVVDEVKCTGNGLKILDLGTGTGKLPELIITQDSSDHITGIDIDSSYINDAKKRYIHPNVKFDYEGIGKKLNFPDSSFDVVTICSVLFLVDDFTKNLLFNESLRVLKPNGKIIVLTPSGENSRLSSFSEL